jgi:hypothetical protein
VLHRASERPHPRVLRRASGRRVRRASDSPLRLNRPRVVSASANSLLHCSAHRLPLPRHRRSVHRLPQHHRRRRSVRRPRRSVVRPPRPPPSPTRSAPWLKRNRPPRRSSARSARRHNRRHSRRPVSASDSNSRRNSSRAGSWERPRRNPLRRSARHNNRLQRRSANRPLLSRHRRASVADSASSLHSSKLHPSANSPRRPSANNLPRRSARWLRLRRRSAEASARRNRRPHRLEEAWASKHLNRHHPHSACLNNSSSRNNSSSAWLGHPRPRSPRRLQAPASAVHPRSEVVHRRSARRNNKAASNPPRHNRRRASQVDSSHEASRPGEGANDEQHKHDIFISILARPILTPPPPSSHCSRPSVANEMTVRSVDDQRPAIKFVFGRSHSRARRVISKSPILCFRLYRSHSLSVL